MNNNRPRNPPTFRERINPLETMSDSEIIKRYRLNLESINRLMDIVAPEIRRPTNRSHAVTPQTQVLLSLKILEFKSGFTMCLRRFCESHVYFAYE